MRGATSLNHPGHFAFAPLPGGPVPEDAGTAGFAAGTAILTTEGHVLVEHLVPGDIAILAGGTTAKIRFIFRQQRRGASIRPVRIHPGALGHGRPARQLTLLPDQALLIDNVLVRAADLIDNATIFQDTTARNIEYFTIALATQGSLLAEGAAAESHSDPTCETPLAPLCQSGPTLAAIRARLAARRRGFGLTTIETLALSARAAGRSLTPLLNARSEASFAIPAGATELLITTPTFTPADFDPASTDRRRLGLALSAITLDHQNLPPEALAISGLHTSMPADPHAWTTGALRLKLPQRAHRLTLHIAARPKTWHFAPKSPVP